MTTEQKKMDFLEENLNGINIGLSDVIGNLDTRVSALSGDTIFEAVGDSCDDVRNERECSINRLFNIVDEICVKVTQLHEINENLAKVI